MKNFNIASNTVKVLALFSCLIWAAGCSDNSTNSDNGNGDDFEEPTPSGPSFNSTVEPGASYSYTFEAEGETEYYCTFHAPNMQGVVVVSSSAESAESDTVMMEGMQFVPSSITVAPGTQVVWINQDNVTHSATSGNPSSGGSGDY